MKRTCRRIQSLLAAEGREALRSDAAAQRHLETCDDCFRMLEAFAELDSAFAELPRRDAPDELVERLLARPELHEAPPPAAPRRRLAALLKPFANLLAGLRPPPRLLQAAATVALAGALLVVVVPRLMRQAPELGDAMPAASQEVAASDEEERLRALGYVGDDEAASSAAPAGPSPGRAGALRQRAGEAGQRDELRRRDRAGEKRENLPSEGDRRTGKAGEVEEGKEQEASLPSSTFEENVTATSEAPVVDFRKSTAADDEIPDSASAAEPTPKDVDPWTVLQTVPGVDADRISVGGNESGAGAEIVAPAEPTTPPAAGALEAFLRERERVEGLSFQPADGYWTNTYVPGDPALRLLEARLSELDRTLWQAQAGEPLRLHDASRQPALPFDPPAQAALAVYLHADRRGLSGETRTLVQVGLRGTERYSGRRPAMNVGVVLDLRGSVSTETMAAVRALVLALDQAKDVGDQFRLIVAGRPGGQLLGPSEFRHGPVTVALQHLLDDPSPAAPALALPEALSQAIAAVSATDDPTRPLGSSLVLLVTARSLAPAADELALAAHRSAVAGVPVSVVGIGNGVVLGELDRLALAGQGNRRLLRAPADAAALIDRELAAVGRVIARALRLRIRLAPGVKLVGVVGARRLDEILAERVREAEKSIDRRLERNLGIAADRGEDEEGIQIVIPAFYAGDAHAVLLDVVAPGPGPVADVTVRYKDLVQMVNGVARAHLSLGRGAAERGALERSVLKSLLAHRLEAALERSAAHVAAGRRDEAARELAAIRELLAGLRELAGFDKDRDLARDLAMVEEYRTLLAAGIGAGGEDRRRLADSLRYAGRLKVQPRVLSRGGGAW